jgi:DNA-binding transcriptional ArsR family regulator
VARGNIRLNDATLDATFAALADPTRRRILATLARGEATVGQLAEPFALSQQAVSQHIAVLRHCGLVQQRVDGPRRPCRLNTRRMAQLASWITQQQREWEGRLARLKDHLER